MKSTRRSCEDSNREQLRMVRGIPATVPPSALPGPVSTVMGDAWLWPVGGARSKRGRAVVVAAPGRGSMVLLS